MDIFSSTREKLKPYDKYSICMNHDIYKWDLLTADRRPKFYPRGEIICNQGDSGYLYIFVSGVGIVTQIKPNGNQTVFYYDLPGSVFGFDSMTSGEPYKTSLISVEDCNIIRVPSSDFSNVYLKNHSLICEINNYEKTRGYLHLSHMEMLMFDTVEKRLALLLLGMAYKCGIFSQSGIDIPIHITHQQFSALINANRVSVSKIFSPLIKNNVLQKNNGYLHILNLDFLLDIAEN